MPIQLSGSLVITGSITTTGVITMSGSIASASYSSTSDLLQGTGSVGFATTASFNAVSSSQQQISSSQQQISASLLNVIAVYATTGSNSFRANQSITGSLVVSSTITAQTLVVQTVTSSIVYSSGSNIFGSDLNSRQTFTGSMFITGSLTVNTTGTEFQVNNNGVVMGNVLTDNHSITGSLRVTGSTTIFAGSIGINGSPGTTFPLEAYINSSTTYASTSRGNVLRVYNSNTTANVYAGIELGGAGVSNDGLAGINGIVTAAGSGDLAFYTRNSNTFGEKVRITSAGNVGIKTSNPRIALEVAGTDAASSPTATANGAIMVSNPTADNSQVMTMGVINGASNHAWIQSRNSTLANFYTLALNPSGGSVGIGTSSPNGNLEVYGATPIIISGASSSGTLHGLEFRQSNTIDAYIKQLPATGELRLYVGRNSEWGGNMTFWTDTVQRMFISSGGEVRIQGAGSSQIPFSIYDGSSRRVFCVPSQYYGYIFAVSVAADGGKGISFGNGGGATEVGSIVCNNASTTYNTTSDYRLKEDLKDFNGLNKISAIKVYDFKWKTNEERTNGVLAHELVEVLPYAVHGEKDGLDRDGNPSYQGVDYSKIVPTLVKAIQELSAKVTALETK